MNLFSWLIFGFLVGVIAHLVDPASEGGGVVGTVTLGILGALVGGLLGDLVFGVGVSGFNFSSFVIAVLGSLLLLFIQRALKRTDYY